MALRGIIRDIISIYIGFHLLIAAVTGDCLSSETLLLYALGILIFSLWFTLERIGIIPKFY